MFLELLSGSTENLFQAIIPAFKSSTIFTV